MVKAQQCVVSNKLPRKRPYICNICFKHFETPSKLARHYLIHTGQKPFECHVCHKTFRQLVHLERHQLTHKLPFKCSICQRHFKNLITFLKHQQLHNETYQNDVKQVKRLAESKQEKPTYGTYRSFSTEERWVLHPSSKSDHVYGTARRRKKIHACDTCSKMFPSRSKLERHLLIHTGQKPFKCSLCSKSFRQSTHLKIHQLTHTEERPFQCCFCQKGFKIQSKLLKHKQIHTRKKNFQTISFKKKNPEPHSVPIKLNLKQDGFENGDTQESEENSPIDVDSIYIVPFQCPECEQCFESEQVLNVHKCLHAGDAKNTNGIKRNHNYKTNIKGKVLTKLRRPGDKQLDAFRSDKKKFKTRFLKNRDHLGEQSSDQNASPKTFKSPHGKFGSYKKVNSTKKKRHLPFSWQKQLQSPSAEVNLKGTINSEGILNVDDSVNNDITIYNPSGEEFFDDPDALQRALSTSTDDMLTRHKMCPCDKCEKVFPSISKLQRHYLIHTGQRPFGCNVCGKSFRQSAHLKRHKLTHIEKIPFKRPIYQVEFENLNKLFTHQGDNSQLVGYSEACDAQEYKVTDSSEVSEFKVSTESGDFILVTHGRNMQPYLSKKLLETEQRRYSRYHGYSGSAEKNEGLLYQCSVCFKSFRSPSKLERHYLIHAGQKPFECSVCGKTFRQAPHWKRHQLTHFKERP
ncbi:zinc finger protein 770 [Sminthopsis crassicaudata]|uniref:zinc finger protein 770 n=1 Tax=Sminthopsis crassicaudata TaxID=9301 RepID=UPI003D68450D